MKKLWGYLLRITVCISMLLPAMHALVVNADGLENAQKTAEELDENNESKVTLTFPGKQDVLASDVVFVLDKSGASAQEDIFNQAKTFLENVKNTAQTKGLNIKVGVVLFNRIGNIKLPLTDVISGYNNIIDAMNSNVSMGTNMHAGLLAAQQMLDGDGAVLPSNKHVVLISDGATYLYSKDGDYTKAYTRSFGDPKNQTNPNTGLPFSGSDKKGGIWESQSREYNLPNNFKIFADGSNFVFSQAMNDPIKLGEYLEYYRNNDQDATKNWSQYEYEYNFSSAYLGTGRKVTPIDNNAPANIEVAMWRTDEVFQSMHVKGYDMNVYFKNAADFDGTTFLKYLARNSNGGELNTDFAEIQKSLLDKIAANSSVEDFIGNSFSFINETNKISLKVGTEELSIEKVNDSEYGFGKRADGTYRFSLTYVPGPNEKFIFNINETLYPQTPVTLSYHVKLVAFPTDPGTHILQTNESAVLHPVDGNGVAGNVIPFPIPTVAKTINSVTFMNGADNHAIVNVEKGKAISTDLLSEQSMPADPTKAGYVFKEWNTAPDGTGTDFTGNTIVTNDMVVYAIYTNEAPTLEVKDATIKQGETLDLMSLVVSAHDKEDGDLKSKVTIVDDGGFNKDKVGKYTITFRVTDMTGASTNKKATVTVIAKDATAKTNDTTKLPLYVGMLGVFGLLVILLVVYRRKTTMNK